ncbi:MAG: 3-deoxy-manno-octulosonate cytidylyltransferase [Saprospiraceae bacterium]|nr:3-deoxy-manno-octulosonate cytidylyltransferase [Saprospiraceae bacterium]
MILAVIPARYASTRFPGKPLAMIRGKSMIQRTWEQVSKANLVDRVVVATDDERIATHVRGFGGDVVLTRADHPSGTDRCAEVARLIKDAQIILNVQGDEPFIQPEQIDFLAVTLLSQSKFGIATLLKAITDPGVLQNPNVVKAVHAPTRGALYFSRHPVPFVRDAPMDQWLLRHTFYKHIGMYAFRRNTLLKLSRLAPTPLEKAESLEQLRWLENGFQIAVGITEMETIGVDTPEDLEKL